MRVSGGGVTPNPFGTAGSTGAQGPQSLGEQLRDQLFGGKRPRPVESDDPLVDRLMGEMHAFRRRLARLAGDRPEDYDLQLAEGTIAMIDADGLVSIGLSFLLDHAAERELRIGVLAHEIGHRPQRWIEYRASAPQSRAEAEALCRLEETRADYFAGWALGQLGLGCEPLCAFLAAIETHPHPEYFPAPLRAKTIREGHEVGRRRAADTAKFFPELARMHGAKNDLGTG